MKTAHVQVALRAGKVAAKEEGRQWKIGIIRHREKEEEVGEKSQWFLKTKCVHFSGFVQAGVTSVLHFFRFKYLTNIRESSCNCFGISSIVLWSFLVSRMERKFRSRDCIPDSRQRKKRRVLALRTRFVLTSVKQETIFPLINNYCYFFNLHFYHSLSSSSFLSPSSSYHLHNLLFIIFFFFIFSPSSSFSRSSFSPSSSSPPSLFSFLFLHLLAVDSLP